MRVCDCAAMATVRRRYVAMMLFMLTFWQTQQLGKSPQTRDFMPPPLMPLSAL